MYSQVNKEIKVALFSSLVDFQYSQWILLLKFQGFGGYHSGEHCSKYALHSDRNKNYLKKVSYKRK